MKKLLLRSIASTAIALAITSPFDTAEADRGALATEAKLEAMRVGLVLELAKSPIDCTLYSRATDPGCSRDLQLQRRLSAVERDLAELNPA